MVFKNQFEGHFWFNWT